MEDIRNLTHIQFKNLVDFVLKKLRWQLKLSIIPVSPDSLKEEDNPMFSNEIEEDRVFTLDDAVKIKEMLNG